MVQAVTRALTTATRSGAVLLALCSILLRGFLPAGWMPNPAGVIGGSPLIICTMDGLHHAMPGGDTQQHRQSGDHDNQICPFAAAAHLAPPAIALALLPILFLALFAARFETGFELRIGTFYRLHSPRAPPVFA